MPSNGGVLRWHVYSTKSLFVITDNPAVVSAQASDEQVHFLGISRDSGGAREGKDTHGGLQQKLAGFGASGGGKPRPLACAAVLGCMTAQGGETRGGETKQEAFLLLACEVAVAAEVDGQQVLEVTRCEALPFGAGEVSSEAAAAVAGVKQLLERGFYLSHDFDITRRLQQRSPAASPPADPMSAADARFVWNRQLVEPLLVQEGVSPRWFTPVMQGFVQMRELRPPGDRRPPLRLLLVARRSSRRAGTRYNARGLDDEGETANWVETEQLVQVPGASPSSNHRWLSLVQVRGSAPIFWEQTSSVSALTVTRGAELGAVAFEKHHDRVQAEYGEVLYVSLLSKAAKKVETEGVLIGALAEQVKLHGKVNMVNLDFHARVTGEDSAFDRELDQLAEAPAKHMERFGYFDAACQGQRVVDGSCQRKQTGTVRTNCFDCLDRTNILQYQLIWRWLLRFCTENPDLKRFLARAPPGAAASQPDTGLGGLFGALGEMMSDAGSDASRPQLQAVLRDMWADLGDALSEQYTGAASTMGAALRQGGHSALAVLEKGWRSVNRVYCERFEDGARQAAIDLVLGKQKLLRAPGAAEVRRAPCGRQLRVAVVTWNLHGRACWETRGALEALLRGACGSAAQETSPDVVIFCFQEITELTAANIVMQSTGDEARHAEFESAAARALQQVLGEPFVKVRSVGMVGLYAGAFVAERYAGNVGGVSADRVKAGLKGATGNKGAVAVRFEVAKTTICALSLHLESGDTKAAERSAQLREVLNGCFTGGSARGTMAADKHDLLVLGGDFNFRLALPPGADTDHLRANLAKGWPRSSSPADAGCVGDGINSGASPDMRPFAAYDELAGERACNPEAADVLREFGLTEGPVRFPATYRLLHGSADYDAERSPAWCDRILHSKVGAVRRRYCAMGGLTQSDHRPVAALLETNLLAMPGFMPMPRPVPQPKQPQQPQQPTPKQSPQQQGQQVVDLLTLDSHPQSAPSASKAAAAERPSDSLIGDSLIGDLVTPPAVREVPGRPLDGASLSPGQLVFAEFNGGWFYANVLRVAGSTCDIAWRRPQAATWGRDQANERYLCSTGADETMHGENIPWQTRIRLASGPKDAAPKAASTPAAASPKAASTSAAASSESKAPAEAAPLDLLG